MSSSAYRSSISELGGGRTAILLLLFALGLYQFYSSGFSAFSVICLIPLFVLAIILAFKNSFFIFTSLCIINYIVLMKSLPLPSGIPASLYNEALEILLLMLAIIDVKSFKIERALNTMLVALAIWCSFIILELLNDTCDMAWEFGTWYTGARMIAFQILLGFLVFSIYIDTPKNLVFYLYLWGGLTLFAVFWIWKQKYLGFTSAESAWLQGSRTHILQGGTLIRYFSVFNDAATGGICLASTAVAFLIFGLTSKIKKYRYIFLAIGLAATWAIFPTGTRTAIVCFMAGLMVYTVLSKSLRLTIAIGSAGLLFFFILAFTNIGQGNQMIRRMRSAFNRNDASAGTREVNKEIIRKHMTDAPFGIGVGLKPGSISGNHKYYIMSKIAPDSEYVFIWIHTGIIGVCIFIFCTAIMFFGASRIVMFKLTSSSLRGIGAGLTCAFVSVQLGGYGNQILLQFPNCLLFYGGLSIVYVLPFIEKEWTEHENLLLVREEEKKKKKEMKKQERRV